MFIKVFKTRRHAAAVNSSQFAQNYNLRLTMDYELIAHSANYNEQFARDHVHY